MSTDNKIKSTSSKAQSLILITILKQWLWFEFKKTFWHFNLISFFQIQINLRESPFFRLITFTFEILFYSVFIIKCILARFLFSFINFKQKIHNPTKCYKEHVNVHLTRWKTLHLKKNNHLAKKNTANKNWFSIPHRKQRKSFHHIKIERKFTTEKTQKVTRTK